jgi:hypothetical protein
MMFRAFLFRMDAGAYWSVVDDDTYETVELADAFLQYIRFGRGRTESTSRKYAEAVALYFSYCRTRSTRWTDPNMTAFQMWLRVAQSPRRSATMRQNVFDTARPVRSDNHIDLISYVVSEMFKFAAAEGFGRRTSLACCSRPPKCGSVRGTVAPPLHTRWSSVDGIVFGRDRPAAEMRLLLTKHHWFGCVRPWVKCHSATVHVVTWPLAAPGCRHSTSPCARRPHPRRMARDQIHAAIAQERRNIADLIDSLDDSQLATES